VAETVVLHLSFIKGAYLVNAFATNNAVLYKYIVCYFFK
jgi:hypothetical protein